MSAEQSILILTSNTGGGHRSAAQALENSFLNVSPGNILVKMSQVLEESTLASRKMADFYNFLLRDHQNLMQYYYWAIEQLKPNESSLIFRSAMGYGRQLFDRICPQALVSVHPMTQHFFAYILKKLNLLGKIPFVTVVTDPCSGFWRGWACPDVDHYYVASDEAKDQLIEFGIGSHKISIMGMPVHSRFFPVEDALKRQYRQSLGLDADTFTIFVNAGWAGGGNIPRIFQALSQQYAGVDNIQVIFLAGSNEKLLQEAHEMAHVAPFPVKVIGFSSEIERLMNASDVMVSKLGGLTTFEALACGLPIIGDAVTTPMPQELQTANFVERKGTGLLIRKPDEIATVIHQLKNEPDTIETMRRQAKLHARLGASDRIAKDVVGFLDHSPHSSIVLPNIRHAGHPASFDFAHERAANFG
ncbi:MAG: glycosyltransferase [Vampirovibrionales bacterium]|nr:glycosyltransferase [Vampirovibrionales bacterium]